MHPRDPPTAISVGAVARRMGLAASTLRTWDQRYGLGPSERTSGSHRRYTPLDVSRLRLMQRLTLEGVPAAEAAAHARHAPHSELHSDPGEPELPRTLRLDSRHGGGRTARLGQGTPLARGLSRAAMSLDTHAVAELLSDALDRRGIIPTWSEAVVPLMSGIGEQVARTGEGVEVEHMASEAVSSVLRAYRSRIGATAEPANSRPVLLSCADEDQHSLPLFALDAALAERHVAARVLGGRVPRSALAAAIRRSGPSAVFLWSSLRATGRADALAELPQIRPRPRIAVGGPGWQRDELPADVVYLDDFAEAVNTLVSWSVH